MLGRIASALLPLACVASGCSEPASPGPAIDSESWSRDRLDGVTPQDAFAAAQFAAAQWFRLDDVRPGQFRLTTAPNESDERGGTGRLRDETIRLPARVRRIATMRVIQQGDASVAECRVTKQRLDTGDYRTLTPTRTFSEHPADNPLPAGASVTAAQSEAWTDVGRDRLMERRILEVVRERLGVLGAHAAATAPASEPAQP